MIKKNIYEYKILKKKKKKFSSSLFGGITAYDLT